MIIQVKVSYVDAVNRLTFLNGKYQLITGLNYQKHNNKTISDFGNIDEDLANFHTVDPYASLYLMQIMG